MSSSQMNILNQHIMFNISDSYISMEPICFKRLSCRAPRWTNTKGRRPITLITTDFKKLYHNACAINTKGYFMTDENTTTDLTVELDSTEFRRMPLEKYIAKKYIDLGMDRLFISYILKKGDTDKMSYNEFINILKFQYIEGHLLKQHSCIIGEHMEYINFEVTAECNHYEDAVKLLKAHKKRVDQYVVRRVTKEIKHMNQNLSLNFYKCTNITVLRDAIILYQFSLKHA